MSQHPVQIPFFSFIICSLQRPQTHPSSAGTNHRLKTDFSFPWGMPPTPHGLQPVPKGCSRAFPSHTQHKLQPGSHQARY